MSRRRPLTGTRTQHLVESSRRCCVAGNWRIAVVALRRRLNTLMRSPSMRTSISVGSFSPTADLAVGGCCRCRLESDRILAVERKRVPDGRAAACAERQVVADPSVILHQAPER